MSIASVSSVTHQSAVLRTPAAVAPARAVAPQDLQAEESSERASVGALREYAAGFAATPAPAGRAAGATPPPEVNPSAPAAPAGPSTPVADLPPLTSGTGSSGSTAFTPARTWASMVGQSGPGGAVAGSAADQGMSQILDDGDVFGADAD